MDEQVDARLDALGDAVAALTKRTAGDRTLAEVRRRLLAPGSPRPAARLPLGWLAAATCAGAVVLALLLWDRAEPTSYEVGLPPVPGTVGEWVAAHEQAVPLRFSEGSTLRIEPGTRLRVTETTARGAALLIERGTLHADIAALGRDTSWVVHAGPFSLQVTGTSFATTWDPDGERLSLEMRQGSVVVNGPLVADRKVVAGERLEVSVREQRLDLHTIAIATSQVTSSARLPEAPAEPPDSEPQALAAAASGSAAAGASAAPAASSSAGPGSAPQPSWRKLAAAGKHREAMTLIDQEGFEQILSSAGSSELLALADVARFTGQPARARQALLALRQRFGARGHSAFLLARIAADQLRSPGEAVQWFEVYLQEQPNGPLAEQALGRILEIRRHGSPEAAQQAAERYLARYPSGAFAALARSVLSR